jgi:hypothetical protein
MQAKDCFWHRVGAVGSRLTLLGGVLLLLTTGVCGADFFKRWRKQDSPCVVGSLQLSGEPGGTWYWMRSPDDEKRVIIGLYNRYCIRCHGVDGRGVWDIPDVPDFTNARWQACRSDGQLTRAILEGRGACMPPFRGTLTLEEGWAMARYLRTFVPGTEVSRPEGDAGDTSKADTAKSKKTLDRLPPPKELPK